MKRHSAVQRDLPTRARSDECVWSLRCWDCMPMAMPSSSSIMSAGFLSGGWSIALMLPVSGSAEPNGMYPASARTPRSDSYWRPLYIRSRDTIGLS